MDCFLIEHIKFIIYSYKPGFKYLVLSKLAMRAVNSKWDFFANPMKL